MKTVVKLNPKAKSWLPATLHSLITANCLPVRNFSQARKLKNQIEIEIEIENEIENEVKIKHQNHV